MLKRLFGFGGGQSEEEFWKERLKTDPAYRHLRKAERKALLKKARQRDALKAMPSPPKPKEAAFEVPPGMSPEEATREKIRRDAEQFPIESRDHDEEIAKQKEQGRIGGKTPGLFGPSWPRILRGPRGGRYTMARTKDGRPYRRYF